MKESRAAAVAQTPVARTALARTALGRATLRRTALAGAAIAAVAVAFRLVRLAAVPPGLYVDEVLTARNALAWRLAPTADWLGSRPLAEAGWVETSNLYLAFASAVLRLFGDGLLAVRMVSVLPSLAAVGLLYGLAAELADRRTGALAAFLLAASHWAARTGRTGWDQVLLVALHLAALWLLARATRRGTLPAAAAAAALLGMSLHTYVAARLAVLHAVLWQGWETLHARGVAPAGRRAFLRLALLAGVVAALALPLLRRHDEPVAGGPRVRQLALWSLGGPGEPWATLGENAVGHLLMFHVRGGAYARDAHPGSPMLDPVTGALLLVGIVVAGGRPGWPRRLLVSWPVVVALGGVLSVSGEGPPYPYRVGSLPAWACLVAAVGGVALWDRAAGTAPGRRRLVTVAAAVGLAAVVALNAWTLFVAGPAYPGARLVYGTQETRIGIWLRDHRAGRPALVHAAAFAPVPPPRRFPEWRANHANFFRPVDSAAAVQLAAGVYARDPGRSLAPLAPRGDVDVVTALPAEPPLPSVVVLAAGAPLPPRWPVERRSVLRHRDGTPLAVVLELAPRR